MKRTGTSSKRKFQRIKQQYRERHQKAVKKALKQRELKALPVDVITLTAQLKPAQTKALKDFEKYISRLRDLGRDPQQITIQAKVWNDLSVIAKSNSLVYKGIPLTK